MSDEATNEVQARPYNAKPVNPNPERGVTNADDALAYVKKPNVAYSSMRNEGGDPEPTEANDEPEQKYKRTNWKKRYDDLRRYQNEQMAQFNEIKAELEAKVTEGLPKFEPPKTPEELATFKKQYPEVYATIETVAYQMAQEQTKDLRQQAEAIRTEKATLAHEKAEQALLKLQPDFVEIRELEDFHDWAKDQPKQIQEWLYEGTDPLLASRAIDMFKADVGWNQSEVQAKPKKPSASAAEAVVTKKSTVEPSSKEKIWTTSEIKAMDWRQYEALKPHIDKAMVEGRVVKG